MALLNRDASIGEDFERLAELRKSCSPFDLKKDSYVARSRRFPVGSG